MAVYFDVHPQNPQPRSIVKAAKIVQDGGLIVYPTDSGFAFGCALGNKTALERIRNLRRLKPNHDFTLVCSKFAQLGSYVEMNNTVFRAVSAATPGQYTFILKATRETPRVMQHPKKKTIGVRVPNHITALALLEELSAPLMSSTLWLAEDEDPMTDGWQIKERLDNSVDAVLDSGDVGLQPTTVIDFSGDEPVLLRTGGGDPAKILAL